MFQIYELVRAIQDSSFVTLLFSVAGPKLMLLKLRDKTSKMVDPVLYVFTS